MKIGYDAKRLYNNFTGLGNYSRTLVKNIQHFFPEDEIYLYTPKQNIESFENATTILPSRYKSTWRNWGVKRDIQRDGIEIFHGLSHEIPFGIHRKNIKTVVTIHDVCYKTFPKMFPLLERMIYHFKYKYSCRNADKIIAISESTKADIIKYLRTSPNKIEVIYQSINPVFYAPQSDPGEIIAEYNLPTKYILYVGSINSRKNLLGIVQAYNLMPEELRLPLVVIGNGSEYKEQVVEYAKKHNLSKYLIMIDSVKEVEQLQAFYQCAKCFVYPSFYEGFGLPVTEALLSGTPTVTSSISSLPEAGGDAALYVNPNDTQQIADAIQKILTNESFAKQLSVKGIKYANETFDPKHLTEQTHRVYESLLNQT